MARTIRTVAGAALLTAFAGALPALASAATLTVRATSNGLPVSVAVSATGRAGQAIATSDASGTASLSLPDGAYAIAAGAPGYKVATRPSVNVSGEVSTTLALDRSGTSFDALPVSGAETHRVVADGKPGVFYVSTFVVPQIFRTTDYGGHWLPVTPGYDDPAAGLPKDRAFRHGATDADLTTSGYPGEVAAVVSDKVYFSADFGMTWHTVGGDAVTNDGPGGPCCRAPALFWGHAGATSVLLARNGADTYVADMAQASPAFKGMAAPYAAQGEPLAVADGADAPWVAVAHAGGTVTVHPLTSATSAPAPATSRDGFPSSPSQIGFGGTSAAGHPPSAVVVSGGDALAAAIGGDTVAMATKAADADPFDAPASASVITAGPPKRCVLTEPGRDAQLPVSPVSGGTGGGAFSAACYLAKSGSTVTLTDAYSQLNAFGLFAFDAGYDGAADPVVLSKEGTRGVAKSAGASGGVPAFPVPDQDAGAGTDPASGGFAVSGITVPITTDTTFGPAGAQQIATVLATEGGAATLASDDGGATTKVVIRRGGSAVAWWQGQSASWLVVANGGTFYDPSSDRTDLISALANWTSATPALDKPNLAGTSSSDFGCSGMTCVLTLAALAGVPGSDQFFVAGTNGNGFVGGQKGVVRRVTIQPGDPPRAEMTPIADSDITQPVSDLAYCPAAGSAQALADVLFIGEGRPRFGGSAPNGALLRVAGATSGSPSVTKVASLPDSSVNSVRANCAAGTVYAGTGGGAGPQQTSGRLFKSTDGGQSFGELTLPACTGDCPNNRLPVIQAVAVNPANADEVLISIGETGLLDRTVDGGATWTVAHDPASAGGRNFTSAGILDLEIPPAAAAARGRAATGFAAAAARSGDVLAGTGGGAYIARVRGSADRTAPRLSSFSVTPRRFAVGPGRTPLSARARRGGVFRFRVGEAGRATIAIAREQRGVRIGRRCRRAAGRRARKRRPCTSYAPVGTLRRSARAGANKVPFSGRLGRRALKPARYRALLVVADAARNRSRRRTARFEIVRR